MASLALGRLIRDDGQLRGADLRLRRAENLHEEARGADLALYPLPAVPDGPSFRLNGPGAFVWRRIDGSRTVGDIAGEMARAYRIPAGTATAQTLRFVGAMLRIGLVYHPGG